MKEKDCGQQFILKYNSVSDYLEFPLRLKNISNLKGCFERDNVIGQIHLSSFNVSIKSLGGCGFSYKKNLYLDNWMDICGFMK